MSVNNKRFMPLAGVSIPLYDALGNPLRFNDGNTDFSTANRSMRLTSLILVCLLATGCQDLTTTNVSQQHHSYNDAMSTPCKDRPPLDFMGPYNVLRSEFAYYDGEIWAESNDIGELSIEEFFEVRTDIVAALSKHGIVYHEPEDEHDFFVYDDKFFDRTQKVELEPSDRLPRIIGPAVAELQRVLKNYPLWRVMFIGHGGDEQAEEQFFIVYPDVVRIRQLQGNKTAAAALIENAQLRLSHFRSRAEHQKKRNADLKAAIIDSFSEMSRSADDAVLVAWFDTVSALDSDWGWEGKPGTSVWVLLREPLPEPFEDALRSDVAFALHWATPDGAVANRDPKLPNARQLLFFEDDEEVLSELVFHLNGKRLRYMRPTKGRSS